MRLVVGDRLKGIADCTSYLSLAVSIDHIVNIASPLLCTFFTVGASCGGRSPTAKSFTSRAFSVTNETASNPRFAIAKLKRREKHQGNPVQIDSNTLPTQA